MPGNDRFLEVLKELKTYFGDAPSARAHFALAQEHGLHVLPVHFFSPVPDTSRLPAETWSAPSEMPGVDIGELGQLDLLERVFSRHHTAYGTFARTETGDDLEFSFANTQLAGADPYVLYSLVRHLKPLRVVEVGGGYSTLVTRRAILENGQGEIDCIEPFPRAFLPRALQGVGRLVRKPVQDVELEVFTSLGKGDILFIDSTHVSRIGGDVNRLFLEILPRLRPGVWVHVHDIFFPYNYPETWIRDMNFFWNEQYLLQAFLVGNRMFHVRFAVGWMGRRHAEAMAKTFPGWGLGMGGGSFWMSREDEA